MAAHRPNAFVSGHAGRAQVHVSALAPSFLDGIDDGPPFLFRVSAGVVRRPGAAGIGPVQHESRGALGVGGGEEQRHRAALGDAEEGGPLDSDRIHDGPHVVHAVLERVDPGDPVGEPRAPLVEADEPREGAQPLEEVSRPRVLPLVFEMGHEAGDEDEVDRPGARDLVGDVEIAALRVLGLGEGRPWVARGTKYGRVGGSRQVRRACLQNLRPTCRFSRIRQSPSESPSPLREARICAHYYGS